MRLDCTHVILALLGGCLLCSVSLGANADAHIAATVVDIDEDRYLGPPDRGSALVSARFRGGGERYLGRASAAKTLDKWA